ncbi:MAG: acetyl-CoA carboxylase biotin carboxyl carrier protein subunit [Rikenellaceae bacterium]|nr:acetyl-CoA carboxylase biotin carboxyl carrier protein subunit [Rikenellaceae bacterium]
MTGDRKPCGAQQECRYQFAVSASNDLKAKNMENNKLEKLPLPGGVYETTLNNMYKNRKPYSPADPKHLLSFIPGEVLRLDVQPGQAVKEGEQLMMYKAMKMENRILSPITGTIKAIHVEVGQNLPKGTLMIEFE